MKKMNVLFSGIMAGILIALSSLTYAYSLMLGHKIIGSVLFSFGLLIICSFGFKLYTGQIGKALEKDKTFVVDLLLMYLGNFIGSYFAGTISFFITKDNSSITETLLNIGNLKIIGEDVSWFRIFLESILCGVLVYLAVEIFKEGKNDLTKVLGLVLSITVFVLCGFSHCIANMYYLIATRLFITDFSMSILSLLVATIGNSIGALLMYLLFKASFKNE